MCRAASHLRRACPTESRKERRAAVQALVYTFIVLAGLAIGGTAYFGLTFTPIEAVLTALVFGAIAIVAMERTLRQRAEGRLERAIEELSRLLATDAQAGAVLSQRINALTDINADKRLEGVEADVSVLGTVVRQVAEAVAELETQSRPLGDGEDLDPMPLAASIPAPQAQPAPKSVEIERIAEPAIPLEMVREALEDNRLVHFIEPIVTLPQRRVHGYDLVPRLALEDGEYAGPEDFLPRRANDVLRHIEDLAVNEAITIARRARTAGQPASFYATISRATLADPVSVEEIAVSLDANRAIAPNIVLNLRQADWQALLPAEKACIAAIVKTGAGISLTDARSLRVDFAELAGEGVRSLRIDAERFTTEPQSFTDFHTADISAFVARFGITLIATGIRNEQHILNLLEDGFTLAQGPHIAGPGPVRTDLTLERNRAEPALRRAEA
jgi:cyclic-di-GMP phosphodiesterase, flagellum assembly factor TipF